ncbi:hypothetical protein SAMN05445756_0846 [Kytococcus aerolatus]|uniref:Uncharacterized protein n=1 Tax=Kytococcus aerolatus TaxID=592308 RepID=A0A212TBE0_9MICO|nr:hypothetical protein [Kytococcus aerolatus]SNC63151.1 hypothetical protein SAMN05445756_0846 [Kytococcus aerolatus]
MTEASKRPRAPIDLSTALIGHLMTGVLKWPVVAASLVALDRWALDSGLTTETLLWAAALGVAVCEVLMTLVQRPFVVKHQHPDPGDPLMTSLLLVAPVLAWAGVLSLSDAGRSWTLWGTATATLVYAVFTVVLEKPWKQGDTRGDVAEKWQETKDMTRDL